MQKKRKTARNVYYLLRRENEVCVYIFRRRKSKNQICEEEEERKERVCVLLLTIGPMTRQMVTSVFQCFYLSLSFIAPNTCEFFFFLVFILSTTILAHIFSRNMSQLYALNYFLCVCQRHFL